jgi:two-component system sensor histidine kinase AlgZ
VRPILMNFLKILAYNAAIAVGLAVVWYLLTDHMSLADFYKILMEVFVFSNLIAFPAHLVLPRVFPRVARRPPAIQWAVFVATLTGLSAAGAILGSLAVLGLKLEPNVPLRAIFLTSLKLCVFFALLIGVTQAAFGMLRDRLEETRSKLREQELERERAVKLAAEARLAVLETRLHPHFLFNTLNSISSLIPVDPQRAERLVERISAILRFALDGHQGGLVDLAREIEIVEDYLEIEQARLRDRLKYRLDAGAALSGVRVPPLSIQTLVENSIKHAIAPDRKGGQILVKAERRNGQLRVEVSDTGAGFSLEAAPPGHGLDNLRKRLETLFGPGADLRAERVNGWSVVRMTVPS